MSDEKQSAPTSASNTTDDIDAPMSRTENGQLPGSEKPDHQEKEAEKEKNKNDEKSKDKGKDEKQPAGGYDSTPIPRRPNGYTLRFTFHRAENLPIGDVNTMSADPYVLAQLNADTPRRHKEDPYMRFRSKAIQKTREPEWEEQWIVANVPASGFQLKLRIYDEDPADKDDKLGGVHINVPSIDENWQGINKETYRLKARGSSWRAMMLQALTTCMREDKHIRGDIVISVENLGRTNDDGQNGRLYTVGPCRWIRHYSPILGRLVRIKDPDSNDPHGEDHNNGTEKKVEHYNFQANQVQLQGPVPADLYHRFVEFKPWVKRMFTSSGLSGVILGSALHHQHSRVYNFGRSTVYGTFDKPCTSLTQQFLDLVHYDEGGRIFTYVLTLDALWRFTETGKEFGIDMLSKHTMHSDVSIYIAFSGEFFIRRLKHPRQPPPPEPVEEASTVHPPAHSDNPEHPPRSVLGGPPSSDPPRSPEYYELVIDNDSGTYRPNAAKLPLLKEFLSRNLPGLHILTLDCQKDEEKMTKMKNEQRERKKKEGDHIIYTQGDGGDTGSISSSDEEDLDALQARILNEDGSLGAEEPGTLGKLAKETKLKNKAKLDKAARNYGLKHDGRESGPAQGEVAE